MSDADETREYLYELALHCLHVAGKECTAGDLCEHMGTLAISEGHPKIAGLSAQVVAGYLRTLASQDRVRRGNGSHNLRHGRSESTWVPTAPRDKNYRLPYPPDPEALVTPASPQRGKLPPEVTTGSPYDHLTREQLLGVLAVYDDITGAVARLQSELERIKATTSSRLAVLGLQR